MLFRRISQHLSTQNRAAVMIDFVIVVVGVFIVIQVSNWNDERVRSQASAEVTERLTQDLREEAWIFEFLLAYYDEVRKNAEQVAAALEGRVETDDETPRDTALRVFQFSGYELFADLGATSGYREAFRMFIPVTIHQALAEHCGVGWWRS